MQITPGRIYAGSTPAEREKDRRARLLAAGLEVMGSGEPVITVRKIVDQSAVSPRYFYDHFAGIEELQIAVFEALLAEAEELAISAMLVAPRGPRHRIRAVIAAMVNFLLDDPRRGRVLLVTPIASPVLGPRYSQAVRRFAGLLAKYSPAVWRGAEPASGTVERTARFAMGGFAAAMASAIAGENDLDRESLVDDLTTLFLAVGKAYNGLGRSGGSGAS